MVNTDPFCKKCGEVITEGKKVHYQRCKPPPYPKIGERVKWKGELGVIVDTSGLPHDLEIQLEDGEKHWVNVFDIRRVKVKTKIDTSAREAPF